LTPTSWVASISRFDGLVHAAATFGDDEESIQQQLLDVLLPFLATLPETMRFLYTGGCWLYGTYKGQVTTEDSPFNPLPAFAWGVPHIQRVLASPGIFPIVIHPAMVYEEAGGVFERFHRDAVTRRAVRVVASESTRWPLVHGDDLAILYRLAFEKSAPGESYIGAAIDGMPVGQIARAFAQRFRTPSEMPETISEDDVASELGNWARGFALDQVQSGEKAMTKLGWKPGHLDPEAEIAAIC
jgi:nucleoside-diphosphate-sugar epimerase